MLVGRQGSSSCHGQKASAAAAAPVVVYMELLPSYLLAHTGQITGKGNNRVKKLNYQRYLPVSLPRGNHTNRGAGVVFADGSRLTDLRRICRLDDGTFIVVIAVVVFVVVVA